MGRRNTIESTRGRHGLSYEWAAPSLKELTEAKHVARIKKLANDYLEAVKSGACGEDEQVNYEHAILGEAIKLAFGKDGWSVLNDAQDERDRASE